VGSPSFILPATCILERSDASLSCTIRRRCSRTRSRTLHTQSLSPRSGIGPRHQLYVALSGLTSKGRKRDKEAALVSCAAAAEYKQGISNNIPKSQVSQHSSEPLVTQGTRLHNLLLSRVGARTSSPRTSMIATGSMRSMEPLSSSRLQPRLTTHSPIGGR
jgi:hypothetical protein